MLRSFSEMSLLAKGLFRAVQSGFQAALFVYRRGMVQAFEGASSRVSARVSCHDGRKSGSSPRPDHHHSQPMLLFHRHHQVEGCSNKEWKWTAKSNNDSIQCYHLADLILLNKRAYSALELFPSPFMPYSHSPARSRSRLSFSLVEASLPFFFIENRHVPMRPSLVSLPRELVAPREGLLVMLSKLRAT